MGLSVLNEIKGFAEGEPVSALWRNRFRVGDRHILYKRVVDTAKVSHHKGSMSASNPFTEVFFL